jgi:D-inositol-3-phosphate glycosyltransferase
MQRLPALVSLYEACPDHVSVVSPGVNLKVFTPGAGKVAAREFVGLDKDVHHYLCGSYSAT